MHRIGRTGRGFAKGDAVSFVSPEEKQKLVLIEEFIQTKLNVFKGEIEEPELKPAEIEEMDIASMLAYEESLVAPRKVRKKKPRSKK